MGSYKTVTTADGVITRQFEVECEKQQEDGAFFYHNLNYSIEFRLTEYGVEVARRECPHIKNPQTGKWYGLQGWMFMSIFGPHFIGWGKEPVELSIRVQKSPYQ